jgi:flavin reductase (DIM6/NTAB) family NADH-FMN oxidoreductase RutF
MDPQHKKLALRAINYGLHVLTSADGDELSAAGVNWLTQVSFEPPLIAIGVKADSHTNEVISRSGVLAVNVLADDQLDVAKAFFRSTTVEGDTLNGHRFEPGPATGCPLLVELPYWFEARVTDTVARGDHTVYVAEVVEAGVRDEDATPLLLRSTGMNYGG